MKMYIEKNRRYEKGYQVRVAYDNGETDLIDYRAYSLPSAIKMAEKALEIINRKSEEPYELKDVTVMDHEGILFNREMDDLSRKMAEKIEAEQG